MGGGGWGGGLVGNNAMQCNAMESLSTKLETACLPQQIEYGCEDDIKREDRLCRDVFLENQSTGFGIDTILST